MKTTLITTFAIALMVFAFDATLSHATEESNKAVKKELDSWFCPHGGRPDILGNECKGRTVQKMDKLHDPDQEGNERDVADSGEEGSTSAVGATEQ
ncbi:MAG: hypothetical protein OXF09_04845 [Hyphomicrobiales bacterium]|nr:hypothetical protein [Hyphomicrobiales bacterium]